MPTSALRCLYNALIECHLIYGIEVWGNSPFTKSTFILQKRAVRTITRSGCRAFTEPLFKRQNLLKIHDLFKLRACVFAYSYVNTLLPSSFNNFYSSHPNASMITTRSSQRKHLYLIRSRTNFSSKSAYPIIALLWNNLQEDMKSVRSKTSFKNKLKQYYLSLYTNI